MLLKITGVTEENYLLKMFFERQIIEWRKGNNELHTAKKVSHQDWKLNFGEVKIILNKIPFGCVKVNYSLKI